MSQAEQAKHWIKLDDELVRQAFSLVVSPGRIEVLHRDPTLIVDAAHNPHGARALVKTLREEFDFESIFGVVAILGDKDVDGLLRELEPVIDRLVVTQSHSERAMPVDQLFEIAINIFGDHRVYKEPSLQNALSQSIEQCTLVNQSSEGVSGVVVTGSVVTAGEARVLLNRLKNFETE